MDTVKQKIFDEWVTSSIGSWMYRLAPTPAILYGLPQAWEMLMEDARAINEGDGFTLDGPCCFTEDCDCEPDLYVRYSGLHVTPEALSEALAYAKELWAR